MRFFLLRAWINGSCASSRRCSRCAGATVPQPLYPVIFNLLPGLRKTSSGSVSEPSGNGLSFLRKNATLASPAFAHGAHNLLNAPFCHFTPWKCDLCPFGPQDLCRGADFCVHIELRKSQKWKSALTCRQKHPLSCPITSIIKPRSRKERRMLIKFGPGLRLLLLWLFSEREEVFPLHCFLNTITLRLQRSRQTESQTSHPGRTEMLLKCR